MGATTNQEVDDSDPFVVHSLGESPSLILFETDTDDWDFHAKPLMVRE